MGVFQSRVKQPPAPVDEDAPLPARSVVWMILRSKHHLMFKWKGISVMLIPVAGFLVALACTLVSILFGNSVVGNIGPDLIWYIVAASFALLWVLLSVPFDFEALSLAPASVVLPQTVAPIAANVVSWAFYFVAYVQNQKIIPNRAEIPNTLCMPGCTYRWAVYTYFSLATAIALLLMGLAQAGLFVWIRYDPLPVAVNKNAPLPLSKHDQKHDAKRLARKKARGGYIPPPPDPEASAGMDDAHTDTDADSLATSHDSDAPPSPAVQSKSLKSTQGVTTMYHSDSDSDAALDKADAHSDSESDTERALLPSAKQSTKPVAASQKAMGHRSRRNKSGRR